MKANHTDGFGGISGHIKTDVELKHSTSGTIYASILLGRDNNLATYRIVFFNQDAERLASQAKKGDLIRLTRVALYPIAEHGKIYASSFALVGQEFEVISPSPNSAPKATDAEPPQLWLPRS